MAIQVFLQLLLTFIVLLQAFLCDCFFVEKRIGNLIFKFETNPGYLLVRSDDNNNNTLVASFGGICSYPLTQMDQDATRLASYFCNNWFGYPNPNPETERNFFYPLSIPSSPSSTTSPNTTTATSMTSTLTNDNTTTVPSAMFLTNVICPTDFFCQKEDYNSASDFFKCSFQFYPEDHANQLSCFGKNFLGLYCSAPLTSTTTSSVKTTTTSSSSTTSDTTATTTTTLMTSSTSSPQQQQKFLPKSELVFTSEGVQIGTDWFIRLNASMNNAIEIRKVSSSSSTWGFACSDYWNEDARILVPLLCHTFLDFVGDPHRSRYEIIGTNSNATALLTQSGLGYAWSSSPQCRRCATSLDFCKTYDDSFCTVGNQVGLFCDNDSSSTSSISTSIVSPSSTNSNNNNNNLTVVTNGGFEWRWDPIKGGLVELRPAKPEGEVENPFAWGVIFDPILNLDGASALCSFFGQMWNGRPRSEQEVIDLGFAQFAPPVDLQPCWITQLLCYSSSPASLDECVYTTNSVVSCGGTSKTLFLECYPKPTTTTTTTATTTTTTTSTTTTTTSTTSAIVVTATTSTNAPSATVSTTKTPTTTISTKISGLPNAIDQMSPKAPSSSSSVGVGVGVALGAIIIIAIVAVVLRKNEKIQRFLNDCGSGQSTSTEQRNLELQQQQAERKKQDRYGISSASEEMEQQQHPNTNNRDEGFTNIKVDRRELSPEEIEREEDRFSNPDEDNNNNESKRQQSNSRNDDDVTILTAPPCEEVVVVEQQNNESSRLQKKPVHDVNKKENNNDDDDAQRREQQSVAVNDNFPQHQQSNVAVVDHRGSGDDLHEMQSFTPRECEDRADDADDEDVK